MNNLCNESQGFPQLRWRYCCLICVLYMPGVLSALFYTGGFFLPMYLLICLVIMFVVRTKTVDYKVSPFLVKINNPKNTQERISAQESRWMAPSFLIGMMMYTVVNALFRGELDGLPRLLAIVVFVIFAAVSVMEYFRRVEWKF
ncbi:hypothetical protein GOZ78_11790 [Agrobacterium vitis]|uniref:DUF2178 domain-containing protein n=1 Tax=Agrobacterium vitis TaxID=373 RepID=A0ABD6GBY1_AGRVI|nr:hypothetical protein [Agrobacterium vitis]MUO81047.1 hypothetical protein [Agrobacterium vitis]MUO96954.1 hypothetical protein [Agrobacterium vitis]MUP06426.1 hypothetical protein [Agrobacterium vitis]MUZ84030.1 hypothetical protein [Agrobacterium vitis]MVA10711.1 hypothetical protein [Agrobacterium vitis]